MERVDVELVNLSTGGVMMHAAKTLEENEAKIVAELAAAQGKAIDIGGYYRPNADRVSKAMRPSATLNAAVAALS